MNSDSVFSFALFEVLGWIVRLSMVPIVLRHRRTPAAAIAWLLLIFFEPYAGSVLYLFLGQNTPLRGPRSPRGSANTEILNAQVTASLSPEERGLTLQVARMSGFPACCGNVLDLEADYERFIDRLVAEIDAAQTRVDLLFYIFWPDCSGRKLAAALIRAAHRGVRCRVLIDAVGSRRAFSRFSGITRPMQQAGIEVAAALPLVGLRRRLLNRKDFRNHRKIAIIDGRSAWTGSQNIVDSSYDGKRGAPWFDLMLRAEGPLVQQLETIFLEDWEFEQGQDDPCPPAPTPELPCPPSGIIAQSVATGPQGRIESFRRVVIACANAAKEELVLTTPYFSPDEPTLLALLMAAERGVRVTLIVPAKSDVRLADLVGRGYYRILVGGGCSVFRFRGGLLHSKTITVDRRFSVVGSANLDVRSFKLNFENGVILYDHGVTAQIRELQQSYTRDSHAVTMAELDRHPRFARLLEEVVLLLSPLL